MRVNRLCYSWQGITRYNYAYYLITNQYSLEDIREQMSKGGGQPVLFGWAPEAFASLCALSRSGIEIKLVCDIYQPTERALDVGDGIVLKDYRELLREPEKYYFILYSPDRFWLMERAKLLQYQGIDEFGILTEGYTKDFGKKTALQDAFFASLNELFADIPLLNQWEAFENLRRLAVEGAGYWDLPYLWIYRYYKSKHDITYFEIGAGMGNLSLSLKKLLDMDVTWAVIPHEEQLWAEWKRASALSVIQDKYNIHLKEGFIETDEAERFGGPYDIIVMAQVMEHLIYHPVNTFKKLSRLLKDDGFLFVSVPEDIKHYNVNHYTEMPYPTDLTAAERERRTQINNFGHFHEYSYEEALEVFEESGLECVFHQWTLPIHHFMLRKKQKP